MSWTPPSKFIVIITFLLWGFGLYILLDQFTLFWTPSTLPVINLFNMSYSQSWLLIAMIVFFLSWFLFFLGVTLKGL